MSKPFKILLNVVLIYKKEQSHANVVKYLPAKSLLYIRRPSSWPKARKIPVLRMPIRRLYFIDKLVDLLMLVLLFVAAASEIVGSSKTDKEFVIVDGNIIKGFTITFIIP